LLSVSCASAEVFQFGSAENVSNPDADDRDFRVQTTIGTHSLFVDGATGFVGINNDDPEGPLDVYRNVSDHYSIFRWGTEATNQGPSLRFMVAAPGVAAAHTNLLGDIRCLVRSTPPAVLESYLQFFVNKGDALTQMMAIQSDEGVIIQDGVTLNPSARLHVCDGAGAVGGYIASYEPTLLLQDNLAAGDHCILGLQGGASGSVGVYLGNSANTNEGGVVYWNALNLMYLRVGDINRVSIDGSGLVMGLSLNLDLNAFYMDIDEIAAPANPAAGTRRLFCNTVTGELSVRTSAGATVSLEAAGGGAQIGGVPAAGQVAFWTAADTIAGDGAMFWDNTDKCLSLGTAGVDIDNTVLTIGSADGHIGFKHDTTVPPTADTHIGAGTYSGLDVLWIRSIDNMIICLDHDDDQAASYFKIIRDGVDPGTPGIITLLHLNEAADLVIGDFAQAGSIGLTEIAAGGVAALLTQVGSAAAGIANRLLLENTSSGGTGQCHLELHDGWVMWDPAAAMNSGLFHAGAATHKIGVMDGPGTPLDDLLVMESLGNIEFVLDSNDDTTDSLFRITRNYFWNGLQNLYYNPGVSWPGEILFTVDESGLVYTPARKIHRKAILDAAYTLDTWVNFDGTNDLLVAYSTLTAARVVTLPAAAAGNAGRRICIKDEAGTAAANNISVNVGVDGVGGPVVVVAVNYGWQWLYSSGAGWFRA
jgi:hypothetical protein